MGADRTFGFFLEEPGTSFGIFRYGHGQRWWCPDAAGSRRVPGPIARRSMQDAMQDASQPSRAERLSSLRAWCHDRIAQLKEAGDLDAACRLAGEHRETLLGGGPADVLWLSITRTD